MLISYHGDITLARAYTLKLQAMVLIVIPVTKVEEHSFHMNICDCVACPKTTTLYTSTLPIDRLSDAELILQTSPL